MIDKQPSCADTSEPSLLPVGEARRRLFESLSPVRDAEILEIEYARGRVLATDVVSPMNVPSQANSAMDGYAICSASIPASGEATLMLVGTAWAGQPHGGRLTKGQAVRIFTGAIMPEGADTVVIQEHVSASNESVVIDSDVVAHRNVRLAGEDVAAGQAVLKQGRQLEAADIGVLASLGISRVSAVRKLKVAFFTTGDELCSLHDHPNQPLSPGMLYDSNRYTLAAMLDSLGVERIDLGIVRDNEDDTRRALQIAAEQADVIVTSGGVSAGEADFVGRVFQDLGQVSFWKLAMRPGRPLAYGHVGKAAFFGLPGNPVAVVVTFLQFVQPALRYLYGMQDVEPFGMPALCLSRLRKSPGRMEYQRGVMRLDESGQLVVETTGKQGAGRLSSMSSANCLIVIDTDKSGVSPGDTVIVQPFRGLLAG